MAVVKEYFSQFTLIMSCRRTYIGEGTLVQLICVNVEVHVPPLSQRDASVVLKPRSEDETRKVNQ